jgi:hypothetical protein
MKPDTHTFWDPEKGKYVTIPASAVIKPPSDDAEFRRKAVVAVDAVVSSAMSGIAKGFLVALAIVLLIWALSQTGPAQEYIGGTVAAGFIVVATYLIFKKRS